MKRYTAILLFVVLTSLGASAQEQYPTLHNLGHNAREFVKELIAPLSPSAPKQAEAKSVIHESAREAIDKYNAATTPAESYRGYRIRIFASNAQSARTDAEAAITLLGEHLTIPAYLTYENPYFLVTCGNCLTQEETIMLLSKVRRHFPKAFIVSCDIPADIFTTPPAPPAPPVEDAALTDESEQPSEVSSQQSAF